MYQLTLCPFLSLWIVYNSLYLYRSILNSVQQALLFWENWESILFLLKKVQNIIQIKAYIDKAKLFLNNLLCGFYFYHVFFSAKYQII